MIVFLLWLFLGLACVAAMAWCWWASEPPEYRTHRKPRARRGWDRAARWWSHLPHPSHKPPGPGMVRRENLRRLVLLWPASQLVEWPAKHLAPGLALARVIRRARDQVVRQQWKRERRRLARAYRDAVKRDRGQIQVLPDRPTVTPAEPPTPPITVEAVTQRAAQYRQAAGDERWPWLREGQYQDGTGEFAAICADVA